jgi:hypothetical protein
MRKIELTFVEDYDEAQVQQVKEIFAALVKSGGLTGVRGGQTIIHFDAIGTFQGVQLSYWPFRRRTKT